MGRRGRQLDGALIALRDRFQVVGTVFQPREIDDFVRRLSYGINGAPCA